MEEGEGESMFHLDVFFLYTASSWCDVVVSGYDDRICSKKKKLKSSVSEKEFLEFL